MAITSGEGGNQGRLSLLRRPNWTKPTESSTRRRLGRILDFDAAAVIDTNLCLQAGIPRASIVRFEER